MSWYLKAVCNVQHWIKHGTLCMKVN